MIYYNFDKMSENLELKIQRALGTLSQESRGLLILIIYFIVMFIYVLIVK